MLKGIACALVCALALVACGGSGGDPDAGPRIDSRPQPDAAPFACGLQATYSLTLGTTAAPAAVNGITLMTGELSVGVSGELPDAGNQALAIILFDNAGMFAPGGAAGSLQGPTNPGTYPLDTDMCGGCLEGYSGYTTTLQDYQQFYGADVAAPGTLTITTFDPPVAGQTGRVAGSYDLVHMLGFDANETSTGCESMVTKLAFVLDVAYPAAVAPTTVDPRNHAASLPRVQLQRAD